MMVDNSILDAVPLDNSKGVTCIELSTAVVGGMAGAGWLSEF